MAESSRNLAYVLDVNDNQLASPRRSPLEVLDTVPESLLRRLKQYSGRLATEAVSAMQERLPFFSELEASQRASVALVVQTAVVNFVEWMHEPHSNVSYTAQVESSPSLPTVMMRGFVPRFASMSLPTKQSSRRPNAAITI